MLSDLGAEVLRVDRTDTPARDGATQVPSARGRRSAAIDLTAVHGREERERGADGVVGRAGGGGGAQRADGEIVWRIPGWGSAEAEAERLTAWLGAEGCFSPTHPPVRFGRSPYVSRAPQPCAGRRTVEDERAQSARLFEEYVHERGTRGEQSRPHSEDLPARAEQARPPAPPCRPAGR
ncbi:hypothetical protein ACFV8Z_09465 [Streptomyces sp. NPDC059837]|uniref:hypothetical protein n=1 Tax=Streptomyces sp. NPDC059837 TaxID=3346968 RepID=UPI00366814A1